MWKKQLLTTDRQVFLDDEYQKRFARVFKTQASFQEMMTEFLEQCLHCHCWSWRSVTKSCDCDYINTNNHAKKSAKTFAIVGSLLAAAGVFTLYKYYQSRRRKKAMSDKPDSAPASVASKPVKADTPSIFPLGMGSPKNDLVRQLQGCLGVASDGVWGSKTQAAFTIQTGRTKITSQAEFDQIIAQLQAKTAQAAGKLRADDITTRWNTDKTLQLMAVRKTIALGITKDAFGALNLTGKNIELGANIPYNRADYTPLGTSTNGYLLFTINSGAMKGMYKTSADNMTLK